jgi:1-pyrroline-5-carboxylate dehydrogenase
MKVSEFRNEPYTDFSISANRKRMEEALTKVRGQLGREYDIVIAGERIQTVEKLKSLNPARPEEIVGVHQKATPELTNQAVDTAHRNFAEWSRTPALDRVRMLLKTASLIRERKYEFDAWLLYEAGKTWPEAEAEVAEAIDFCEYYAREMLRLAGPHDVVQLPGEHDEMRYLPLGVGVVIPPWNFPLAILAGMTCAALVTGNTVVIKPSSETPTIAAVFAETLIEAGFPPRSFCFLTGSGGAIGDLLVANPRTRFVSFTGSRDVGLHINELAAKPQKDQIWIKRVVAEMGGKDAIIVDGDCDLDAAVEGVAVSAFGYQGQKCSACSRAIVHEAVYDRFLEKLKARTEKITVGEPDDPAHYMGAVISAGAKKSIQQYIETGKNEGRLLTGGEPGPGSGYFLQPTIIADVDSTARVFQEEIFGPVLAVAKATDFDHALRMANDSQYGLTGAIYSNNPAHIAKARE